MPKNTVGSLNFINLVEEPICYLSSDFVILEINDSVENIFNMKKDSIIGAPFSVLCPDFDLKISEHPFEGDLMTHIGKKTLSWHPLFLKKPENGIKLIVIGTINNKEEIDEPIYEKIANQLLAEQLNDENKNSLEHEKNIYRYMENIIAQIPVSVYWMNQDCVYLGCSNNMAKLLNLKSRHDMVGKTYADLYDKKSTTHYKKADKTVMDKGISLNLEEPLYYPDGTSKIYLSNKVPLYDLEGKIIGMLGVSVDITDRKKMEEDLRIAKEASEAASRAKTEFIANMGHDIRTPLTGIIGFSHYLEDKINTTEEKDCAKQIHESGEQLLNLLNGVLDMITADSANENSVRRETFDIHDVVHDVLKLELPAVKAHHLDIETHIDKSVPHYVVSDKMKLHRILLNLAGNAIKFTKIGHIELNAKLLSQENNTATVEFEVKDTGIGIPDALQNKVFDRFFKVSPSYKGLYTGNGIGLHIAQKYVELLGGQIRLTSKEGVGTSFFFTLKMKLGNKKAVTAAPAHGPIASQSMTQATARLHPKKLHVLLIEDNVPALTVLQMMFKPFDVEVVSAKDAESAFLLVLQQPFDLIISDIGLPKQSGNELAKEIREYEKENHRSPCTIIGLTGHSLGEITKTCLESGMNEVYQKPLVPEALEALMARFIPCEKESDVLASASEEGLGMDLPNSEEELFALDHLPLLDMDMALKLLGTEKMVRTVFTTINTIGILPDLDAIKIAHDAGDWAKVQALVHKMKAGSLYGTVQLHYAFLYLERYQKAGHTVHLEGLYTQMLQVIDKTIAYLDSWLMQSS